jgi:hypothetical protein
MTEKQEQKKTSWRDGLAMIYDRTGQIGRMVRDIHNALGVPKDAQKHLDPMEEELRRIGGILDSHNGQFQAISNKLDELNSKLQAIDSAARDL